MKERSNMKIWIYLIVSLFPLLTSCEYVDFYEMYERSEVNVVYDWNKVGQKPKAMRLALYPADVLTMDKVKQGYMIYDLYSDGRTISLPVGKYLVSTWNTDVNHTIFMNQQTRPKLSVSTTPIKKETDVRPPVLDSIFGNKPILYSPEYLVRDNIELFTVAPDQDSQVLMLHPDSMLSHVDVEITGIKNLSLASKVSAAVGTVPGTGFIADTTKTSNPVVWMFDCSSNADKGQINGSFYSFDLSKSTCGVPKDLCIFIWTPTGNIYIPLKIAIPKDELDDRFIHIKIKLNIDLKDYVTKQDGFEVEVDDWTDVEIEIPM